MVLLPLFWDMVEPCGYLFANREGWAVSSQPSASQLTLDLMIPGGVSPLNHSNAR